MDRRNKSMKIASSRRQILCAVTGALGIVSGCVGQGSSTSSSTTDTPQEWSLSIENHTSEQVTAGVWISSGSPSSDDDSISRSVTLDPDESQTISTVYDIGTREVQVSVESELKKTFDWPACTGYGSAIVLIEAESTGRTLTFIQAHGDPDSSNCEI